MTRPIIRIHDLAIDEVIDREMTDEEFAKYELDKARYEAEKAEIEAKEAAKNAILERIGLTAEELKTILG